tara:strand:- start:3278 stop:5677 length:2400 start_codon:yes stop_codon:yes gene_type:complete
MYRLVLIISSLWFFANLCVDFARAETSSPLSEFATPLREEIDRIIDAERVGPPAPLCTDAEYLRRAYLDLAGKIPSAQEATVFLEDTRSDKRSKLVDMLLEQPHFDRNFMRVLDVMLMERRIEKVVSPGKFRDFLRTSIEERQPLNTLIRDILVADGVNEDERSAARFLLDRSAEPHVVTRDVGRIFLGVDMQCAQCHDHPSIDDYLQSDYYGIFAFLNRSYLFGGENGSVVAERAEGEVEFVSVFVGGDPKPMMPHLPGSKEMQEPEMSQEERYIVKPAEGVRPVPKFSRRSLLANELTSGKYQAFQKNLANRLWAHMFGRGIVHPLDFHHSENPPTNPVLLNTLAAGLADLDFDLRKFMREIALSQTYQRSSELPSDLLAYAENSDSDRHAVATALDAERSTHKQIKSQLRESEKLLAELDTKEVDIEEKIHRAQREIDAVRTANDSRQKQLASSQSLLPALEEGERKLRDLKRDAAALSQVESEDSELQRLVQSTTRQYQLLNEELHTARKRIETLQQQMRLAREIRARHVNEYAALEKQKRNSEAERLKVSTRGRTLKSQLNLQQDLIVALEAKLEDFACLNQWKKTLEEKTDDEAAQQDARQLVADRWRNRFQCGHILPLTAEQLTWSVSEALGIVAQRRQNLLKSQKEKAGSSAETESEKNIAVNKKELAKSLHNQIEGGALYDFIINVHDFRGQPDGSYQATAKEALFLSHSKKLQTWISEAATQWLGDSSEQLDPEQVAEKLYLTILSRQPDAEESAVVRGYLVARMDDPRSALQDLIWALLSCTEFRFQS